MVYVHNAAPDSIVYVAGANRGALTLAGSGAMHTQEGYDGFPPQRRISEFTLR